VRRLAAIFFLLAVVPLAAADPGDAEKAKEMLARVVVAVELNQNAAMANLAQVRTGSRMETSTRSVSASPTASLSLGKPQAPISARFPALGH
jgi:hypothetical protein